MKQYIRAVNGNIPIILQGRNLVEYEFRNCEWVSLSSKEYQFRYTYITDNDQFYKHSGNKRLYKYKFGRGLIYTQYDDFPCAIICEDKKVAVLKNWSNSYTVDFGRFKKMLKENGYNVKKNITYLDNLEGFYFNPLSPTFYDYQEEYQREVSKEFILSQRPVVVSSVEDNIDNEAKIEIDEVPLTREQEEDLFLAFLEQ